VERGDILMPSGLCPDCARKIGLNPAKVGQLLTCPHCDVQLEVIGDDPLEFDWAYDWAWSDEDEEDQDEQDGDGDLD
jgi:lysine biosynthesis protein LysW